MLSHTPRPTTTTTMDIIDERTYHPTKGTSTSTTTTTTTSTSKRTAKMMSQRREKKHVRSSDDDCLAAVAAAAAAAAVVVVSDSEDSCASGIGSLSGSSCGGERPCMRRSSETEEASLDSPILRPYRHLSANDLNQCIGEEETEVSEQEDAEDDIDNDDIDIDDNNNNASCGGGEDDHPATIEAVSSVHYYNNPLSMRMAKSLADNAGPSHLFGAGTRYLNLTLPYPVRTPTYPNYYNNNNNNNKYGGCSDTDVDSDYGQFSDLSHHSNEAIMNEAINIALDTTSDDAAAAAAAAYLTTSSF